MTHNVQAFGLMGASSRRRPGDPDSYRDRTTDQSTKHILLLIILYGVWRILHAIAIRLWDDTPPGLLAKLVDRLDVDRQAPSQRKIV